MNQQVEDLYNELTDELKYKFGRLLDDKQDNKASFRYRMDGVYRGQGRSTGKFVIGRENGEELTYAYRLLFSNQDDESKPDRIYWYTSETGFSNLALIMSEKEAILKSLGFWNATKQERVEPIPEIFDSIDETRSRIRSRLDMEDVKDMLFSHNKQDLQNIVANNSNDSLLFWKLLFSKNGDGDVVENDINIVFSTDDRLVARSERTYHNGEQVRRYPMAVLVEKRTEGSQFYIHRLVRNDIMDNKNRSWSEEDVLRTFGCDRDLVISNKDSISPEDGRVRVAHDTILDGRDYKSEMIRYRSHIFDSISVLLYDTYGDNFADRFDIPRNFRLITHMSTDGMRKDFRSKPDIRDVQSSLDIPEEDVRRVQESRNIGRLSNNLRQNIVQDLYLERFLEWIYNCSTINMFQYIEDNVDARRAKRHFPSETGDVLLNHDAFHDIAQNIGQIDRREHYSIARNISSSVFSKKKSPDEYVDVRAGEHSMSDLDRVLLKEVRAKPNTKNLRCQTGLIVPEKTTLVVNEPGLEASYEVHTGVYYVCEPEQYNWFAL